MWTYTAGITGPVMTQKTQIIMETTMFSALLRDQCALSSIVSRFHSETLACRTAASHTQSNLKKPLLPDMTNLLQKKAGG